MQEFEAIISKIFTPDEEIGPVSINLYRGEERLLDQSDGPPGFLVLSDEEFDALQKEFASQSIPSSVFYDSSSIIHSIEPMELFGGAVLVDMYYGPLSYTRARTSHAPDITIPSEDQRLKSFDDACNAFIQALNLRLAEMHEPGKVPDDQKVAELVKLNRLVREASRRARAVD